MVILRMDPNEGEEVWKNSTSHPGNVTYDLEGTREWLRSEQAFVESLPEEFAVKIPCKFHRHITGQRGHNILAMADHFGVEIELPIAFTTDSITLRGPPSKCAEVKRALLLLVEELAAEEERRHRSYCETIRVELRHFPVLVGRKGMGLRIYRLKHHVDIELPVRREGPGAREIAIFGHEQGVKAAKQDMLEFLQEFDAKYKEEVKIDRRVYSRMIGPKGNHATKLQKRFNVKIDFPKEPESDLVRLIGTKENIENAKRYLLHLEDCYTFFDDQKLAPHSPTGANDAGGASSTCTSKRPSCDLAYYK